MSETLAVDREAYSSQGSTRIRFAIVRWLRASALQSDTGSSCGHWELALGLFFVCEGGAPSWFSRAGFG